MINNKYIHRLGNHTSVDVICNSEWVLIIM